MAAESLWTIKDIAGYANRSVSWVEKRVAPKTKLHPKIPRLPGSGHPRFDPAIVKEVLRGESTDSSLIIKEMGKSAFLATPKNRQKEKLF